MTPLQLQAAQREMRERQPRKPMQRVLSNFDGAFAEMRHGLETLAEIGMPYHTVMAEVAKLYVRSAVKIHGSYTRAAIAVHAHRNTLHRVERER